jgi:uncharacterized protein (DUF433 family)
LGATVAKIRAQAEPPGKVSRQGAKTQRREEAASIGRRQPCFRLCIIARRGIEHSRFTRWISSMAIHWQDFIEERKDVMLGKPVFKGTRLTVQHILEELGGGMSFDELSDNYPTLKPEHIQAALKYAAAVVAMDQSIYE